MTKQPIFDDFLPRFLRLLFGPEDRVVLATAYSAANGESRMLHHSLVREGAISALLGGQRDIPNLYFMASSHDGGGSYSKTACLRTTAFFLDLDYGKIGHKKPSPFDTFDDCLSYLITLPLRPSIAWHTGHGIQACYLLDTPYVFDAGGGPSASLNRYEEVSKRFSMMAMSDDTYNANHLFRVPMTINSKKNTPAVTGDLLWCEDNRRYTFRDIEEAVTEYGAADHMEAYAKRAAERQPKVSKLLEDVGWEGLPEKLQDDIMRGYAEGSRSESLFRIVARMVRDDYSDETIIRAVGRGPSFVEKYDRRLESETRRIIGKCRSGKYVYSEDISPAIDIPNTATIIGLHECAPLPAELDAMLDRYSRVTGAALSDRVRQAARFHEHLFSSHRSGILESPCGAGKSTWAISHIALHAGAGTRYIYVTETLDALYSAAETLESLTEATVGRVHGFNREKCHQLCKSWRNWWDCGAASPDSVCHNCEARTQCRYFNRKAEQGRNILCLTHSGLIGLLEENSALLDNAAIIVDEGLVPFCTDTFTQTELTGIQNMLPDASISDLFPHSRIAHSQELDRWNISKADTFASRNFVFRNARQFKDTRNVWNALRVSGALGRLDGNQFKPGDVERKREIIARLRNMFRPAHLGDSTYAYREIHDKKGLRYAVTRQRFRLETDHRYNKLWMLNASAQLTPYAYPDNMPVFTCPELPDNSGLLTIHVAVGNPTASRKGTNLDLSRILHAFEPGRRSLGSIMIATNMDDPVYSGIEDEVAHIHGQEARIIHLTRGRIKGVNTAGECELAILTGMATFNGLDECALHAALILGRTFPDYPYVFSRNGTANWPGGMPIMPVMRNLFALRALDEIYQALYRVCIRKDRPAKAIIAVPGPEWLATLWRTVMPRFKIGCAYRDKTLPANEPAVEYVVEDPVTGKLVTQSTRHIFEQDALITGLAILNLPAGTTITKSQVAVELGYQGKRAWEKNKPRIMHLIGHAFDEDNARTLKRRDDTDPYSR